MCGSIYIYFLCTHADMIVLHVRVICAFSGVFFYLLMLSPWWFCYHALILLTLFPLIDWTYFEIWWVFVCFGAIWISSGAWFMSIILRANGSRLCLHAYVYVFLWKLDSRIMCYWLWVDPPPQSRARAFLCALAACARMRAVMRACAHARKRARTARTH